MGQQRLTPARSFLFFWGLEGRNAKVERDFLQQGHAVLPVARATPSTTI